MNKPIGGYFELELTQAKAVFPHFDGVLLNSGRHSLEYILRALGIVKRLWIPYFTCDVVRQSIERLQIPYQCYHIDKNLMVAEEIHLEENEYFLYTNYYGIMDSYCRQLANLYGSRLILDNAQALYVERYGGIHTFYSPRKFVGIPDGGIAYTDIAGSFDLPRDMSYNRCSHLLKRYDLIPSEGYQDFRNNSQKISEAPLAQMSALTQSLLLSIDFDAIRNQRIFNFNYLHKRLAATNELQIPQIDTFACPMVYPYYTKDVDLRQRLIGNQVFVATYWPNVLEWCTPEDLEYKLTTHIIPLPIDQRYGQEEMEIIINLV